jgi:osmotically-inducible protein OsmY
MAQRSDEQIREAIHERLVKLPFKADPTTLEIDVADGIVTLKGNVPGTSERQQLTKAVEELNLAKKVRDELRITTGPSDS